MRLVKTSEVPATGVSHNPEIKKKVLVERGVIPQVMTFGEATFLPGQGVDEHVHDTAYEVFYIQSGKAEFVVNGEAVTVFPGDCIVIEQGEKHFQHNPFENSVTWLYFMVATD